MSLFLFLGLTFIADKIDLECATLPAHVGFFVLVAEDVQNDTLDPDAMLRFAYKPAFRHGLWGGYSLKLGSVSLYLKHSGTVLMAQRRGEREKESYRSQSTLGIASARRPIRRHVGVALWFGSLRTR